VTTRTDLAGARARLREVTAARKLHAKACRKCAKLRHLRYMHCDEGWALLSNQREAQGRIKILLARPGPEQPTLF
jgi:hypothetical protein